MVVIAALGLLAVVAMVLMDVTRSELASPGGWFDTVSRMCAMVGSYLMLIMVVLIVRIPWLERSVGQDTVVRWHRWIGGWPIVLIGVHIVTITYGYAALTGTGVVHQFWIFLTQYPDILAATVGFALMVLAALTSLQISRRHLKYETWWIVHLYLYIALALAFAHQIGTGDTFVGHAAARMTWIVLWGAAGAFVLIDRFLVPILRNAWYRLRVEQVVEETPGVYTLTIAGHHLESLAVSGGQFFQWRFLAPDLWWHSHPYSLSALPHPPHLRVTIKALGDQSRAVGTLRPGTLAFIEGPYGVFTRDVRTRSAVTFIGAGLGVMPLRALLEDIPAEVPITVVLRATRDHDLVHRAEIHELVAEGGGSIHEVIGPRDAVSFEAADLARLAPDVADSDVYLCGPPGFVHHVRVMLEALNVPASQVHVEEFDF